MTLEQGCRHLQVARLAGMHFPQNLPPVPASCSSRCPRGCTWQVIMTWWTRLTPVMRVFRHAMQHRWLTAPMDDMSDPTRTRLRLRFVYKHYVAPVGLSHADAAGSSISILKVSRQSLMLLWPLAQACVNLDRHPALAAAGQHLSCPGRAGRGEA